jgi:hypothetical protein
MRPSTLKTSSFVAYFNHLTPDEAAQACANLHTAVEDICGDVDNWKAYVAKRYGFKYSVQRPDLLTAEEWIEHARILETLYPNLSVTHKNARRKGINAYVAITDENGNGILRKNYHPLREVPLGIDQVFVFFIRVYLPGLPLVISQRTKQFTYHVARFYVNKGIIAHFGFKWNIVESLDDKHPSSDSTMFESAEFCKQWYLELFMPYYSFYINQGYTFTTAEYAYGVPPNHPDYPEKNVATFQAIFEILPVLLGEQYRSFELSVRMTKTIESGDKLDPLGSMLLIYFRYIPARLP